MSVNIQAFFDPASSTYSYVVSDPVTGQCAIVDPVLDYDAAAGRISHQHADELIAYVREQGLAVQWLLETHVHADHLSAAAYIKSILGGRLAIGDKVSVVQEHFTRLFNTGREFVADGRQFDHLLHDGESFQIGSLSARVMHTPGHTPGCVTYLIEDAAFVGDTLFMPDYGTARCDFPGGDARVLYRSISRLYALPDETRLFMCHDYLSEGRRVNRCETSVAEQRRHNVHVHDGTVEAEFVAMRETRDATLSVPALMLPAVQVNMRGGQLPPAEDNGVQYLKVPLNVC